MSTIKTGDKSAFAAFVDSLELPTHVVYLVTDTDLAERLVEARERVAAINADISVFGADEAPGGSTDDETTLADAAGESGPTLGEQLKIAQADADALEAAIKEASTAVEYRVPGVNELLLLETHKSEEDGDEEYYLHVVATALNQDVEVVRGMRGRMTSTQWRLFGLQIVRTVTNASPSVPLSLND